MYFEPKFNLNLFAVLVKIRLPFPDPRVLFTETRWFRMNLPPFPRTLRVYLTSNKRIYTTWATPIITNNAETGIGCVICNQSFRCNSTGICSFSDDLPNMGLNNNTINAKPELNESPRASPRPTSGSNPQPRYHVSPASSMHLDSENPPIPMTSASPTEDKVDDKSDDQAEDLSNKASRNGSPSLASSRNRYHPYAAHSELMIKSE